MHQAVRAPEGRARQTGETVALHVGLVVAAGREVALAVIAAAIIAVVIGIGIVRIVRGITAAERRRCDRGRGAERAGRHTHGEIAGPETGIVARPGIALDRAHLRMVPGMHLARVMHALMFHHLAAARMHGVLRHHRRRYRHRQDHGRQQFHWCHDDLLEY